MFKCNTLSKNMINPDSQWRLADGDSLECKKCSFPFQRTNILSINVSGFLINIFCKNDVESWCCWTALKFSKQDEIETVLNYNKKTIDSQLDKNQISLETLFYVVARKGYK